MCARQPVVMGVGANGPTPEADFARFYRSEFARLAVIATAVSGDPSWGEDIAQDALTRAQRRWAAISSYDKPGSWVRRVAINLAISRRRRLMAESRAVFRIGSQRQPSELQGDPEVWRSVAKLPRRQRAVIVLHYLEDRPVAEIADIMDMSVSAVTSNLYKARQRLAETLGEELSDTRGGQR